MGYDEFPDFNHAKSDHRTDHPPRESRSLPRSGPPSPCPAGQDGARWPRPGVKLIARAAAGQRDPRDLPGLWQTTTAVPAISARDEDVDCIAASMMSNSHLVLVPRLIEECAKVGRPDMRIQIGGIIPQEDVQPMFDAGVSEVFHTGTSMQDIVECVRKSTTPYEPLPSDHPSAVLARAISDRRARSIRRRMTHREEATDRIIGLTGSPGAGKSTLVACMAAELVARGRRLAVIAFDPMSPD